MRPKKDKPVVTESSGVAEGLHFDHDEVESQVIEEEAERSREQHKQKESSEVPASPSGSEEDSKYNKYYRPHPQKGSKGGDLGRRIVPASERKIQFSVTCTPDEKERYVKAAQQDHRKLPDLVTTALDEYIKNHKLE